MSDDKNVGAAGESPGNAQHPKPQEPLQQTHSQPSKLPAPEAMKALTGVGWMLIAAVFVFVALIPNFPNLLARVDSVSLGPDWAHIALTFHALTEASDEPGRNHPPPVTEAELKPLQARAKQLAPHIPGRRILWVDSRNPEKEYAALTGLGFVVDVKHTNKEALDALESQGYDLLVTNMERGDDHFGGVTLLNEMCKRNYMVPGIVYSWGFDTATGVPVNAAHATNRATLFQLIFDQAELGFPRAQCKPNFCVNDPADLACDLKLRLARQVPQNMASAFLYDDEANRPKPAPESSVPVVSSPATTGSTPASTAAP